MWYRMPGRFVNMGQDPSPRKAASSLRPQIRGFGREPRLLQGSLAGGMSDRTEQGLGFAPLCLHVDQVDRDRRVGDHFLGNAAQIAPFLT